MLLENIDTSSSCREAKFAALLQTNSKMPRTLGNKHCVLVLVRSLSVETEQENARVSAGPPGQPERTNGSVAILQRF